MIRIDLHVHSTHSDGTLSPDALVQRARRRHISVMALTDHDTTDGVASFLASCSRWNIRGIPGIELSAQYERTMHILGYRIDGTKESFKEFLSRIREGRTERNEAMCAKLQALGIPVTMEEVRDEAKGEIIARPHMARVMVRKGFVPDLDTAYSRYLGTRSPAYVERYRPEPKACIEAIRDAGGVAVLAHPFQTEESLSDLSPVVSSLKDSGLWGMECLSSHHSAAQSLQLLELAGRVGLYTTGGSDFHGDGALEMGIDVSDGFLPWGRLGIVL